MNLVHMSFAVSVVVLSLVAGGCKIVPTPDKAAVAAAAQAQFDPVGKVAEIWESKAIPFFEARAGNFDEVTALARADADAAGARYGHRDKEGNEPWTFVVKFEGRIVSAQTASRAATIGIDTAGDGKAHLFVQIGPAFRGTALRDALDFVSFNDFRNQIDYAQFGKAFNQQVEREFLASLPREGLIGRKVSGLGAYSFDAAQPVPLVTPARLALGPAS